MQPVKKLTLSRTLVMVILVISSFIPFQTAYASAITVTTTNDVIDVTGGCPSIVMSNLQGTDGLVSLREAICAANNTIGYDTINLPAGTYTLSIPGSDELSNATGSLDVSATQEGGLTIKGAGASVTIIQACEGNGCTGIDRVLFVDFNNPVFISDLTIRNGNTNTGILDGGGILNAGLLELKRVILSDNSASGIGGGIFNFSSVLIRDSTIINNNAGSGGGVFSNVIGLTRIYNTTISGNTAALGGGIAEEVGSCFTADTKVLMADGSYKRIADVKVGDEVVSFDFAANQRVLSKVEKTFQLEALGYLKINGLEVTRRHPFAVGADQWKEAWRLKIGDQVLGQGWSEIESITYVNQRTQVYNLEVTGLHNYYVSDGENEYLVHNKLEPPVLDNPIGLYSSTVTNNTATVEGGGIYIGSSYEMTVANSIIAENLLDSGASSPDCSGPIHSDGNNLFGDTSGCTISGTTSNNITGQDPLLEILADNGGATPTHALLTNSPAIDSGNNEACEFTDQRGISRPQGASCDIGAFEFEPDAIFVAVQVDINGSNVGSYNVPSEARVTDGYGINGGPVHVVSTDGVTRIFTSERTIFGNSFNSIVGYPGDQLTTEYWFTSYDDLGMITYLVIGNPSTSQTAEVDVYIAGNKMNSTPYQIAPGQRIFPRYGTNAGPVRVISTNGVNIFTSERTKFKNSFNEVMGYPGNQLTTEYWFTSYDDVGMITYLVIGNSDDTLNAEVDVYIGGNLMGHYSISPGERVFPRYGINGGPVRVVSTNGVNVFTSERTKFGETFNEVMGYPADQSDTEFWFTSYDDAGMITYLVVGNPSSSQTAKVDVYIGGVKKNATPYSIDPGQRMFARYSVNDGPLQVISTNGVDIFASERSKYLSSFNEILGMAADQLATDYWFTSYDDVGMSTFLVIGTP